MHANKQSLSTSYKSILAALLHNHAVAMIVCFHDSNTQRQAFNLNLMVCGVLRVLSSMSQYTVQPV